MEDIFQSVVNIINPKNQRKTFNYLEIIRLDDNNEIFQDFKKRAQDKIEDK